MDNQSRIAQAYGYAVCFITIITMLISVGKSIDALFNYADPVHAERWGSGGPVTSFNAWKREFNPRQNVNPRGPAGPVVQNSVYSETDLRQMYQDDRNDQIETVRFRSMKTLIGALLLIVVSATLFAIHWKWLRRQSPQRA